MSRHPYAREKIGLATMHAKERALALPFRRLLDAEIVVAPRLDTDRLGTFSGEIPRPGSIHRPLKKTAFQAILAFDRAGPRTYNPRPRCFAAVVARRCNR